MTNALIIDLDPLSCMGLQANLKELFPKVKCQSVHTVKGLKTIDHNFMAECVLLGLNEESSDTLTALKEVVLSFGQKHPLIICYQHFDLSYLKYFARSTLVGLLSKGNVSKEFTSCVKRVIAGHSYLCESTSQHVIELFANPDKKRKRSRTAGVSLA